MQIHLMKLQLRLVFIYSHLDIEAWTISQVQKLAAIFLFQFAAVFLRIYAWASPKPDISIVVVIIGIRFVRARSEILSCELRSRTQDR